MSHNRELCQFLFELSYALDVPSTNWTNTVRLKRSTKPLTWYEKWSVESERWPLE